MSHHRWFAVGLALLTTALLGAACTYGDTGVYADDIRILPIEDILDGDIEVVDLTPTSGVVRVTTSVDVVCSVVFGTTREYGGQATDLDMAGGSHRTHAAPMRGLEPDTEYHYRLQGTGPDGTVYVSESMTFRTPPAAEAADRGVNMASTDAGARITDVSSVFGESPSWSADHAIDGDPTTEWSSAGDGDAAYFEVTLRERRVIGSIGIWTRTMGTSAEITAFQVTADGGRVLGSFDVPDASGMHTFPLPALTEVEALRFEVVSSTGGNTGLVKVAAYEE